MPSFKSLLNSIIVSIIGFSASAPLQSAETERFEYTGGFFDLLVYLNYKYDIKCGLDPQQIRLNQNQLVTRVQTFRKGSDESIADFLRRSAKENELRAEKMGEYYYLSGESKGDDEKFAEKVFVNRNDLMAASRSPEIANLGSASVLAPLMREIQKAESYRRDQIREIQEILVKMRALQFKLRNEEAGSALSQPNHAAAEVTRREQSTYLRELVNKFNDSLLRFQSTLHEPPKEYRNACSVLPKSVVAEYLLLSAINYSESGVFILGHAGMFFKPEEVQSVNEIVSKLRNRQLEFLEEYRERTKTLDGIYRESIAFWHKDEMQKAYNGFVRLFDMEDYSARTRLAYGILAVLSKVEQSTNLKQKIGKSPSQGNSPLELIGSDSEAGVLSTFVDFPVKSRQQERNAGRQNAVYGLVVGRTGGAISTFSVKLLEEFKTLDSGLQAGSAVEGGGDVGPQEPRLKYEGLNENRISKEFNVEIHAKGEYIVDDSMKASIEDALHYVHTKYDQSLQRKRVLVIFNDTVGINYGGDSAGAALVVSLISHVKQQVPRGDVCMTGSIRAYGDIRAVGGIVAKLTAAANAGFNVVLVPAENICDLLLMDIDALGGIQIITGNTMSDYVQFAIPLTQGDGEISADILKSYSIAYNLYKTNRFVEALGVLKRIQKICPNHYSASTLIKRLELVGLDDEGMIPVEIQQMLPRSLGGIL